MTVTAVNQELEGDPSRVNADAMGAGWLIKVTLDNAADLDGLMDQAAYADQIS